MSSYNLADLWETLTDAEGGVEVVVAGSERRTRSQLDERATRLANHLAASGVQPGDHVGVYSLNRVEYLETLLALFKLRAVPININYRYVDAELEYIFRDSGIVALVYERGFATEVRRLTERLGALRAYVELSDDSSADGFADGVDYERAVAGGSAARSFGVRSSDDLYIIYTGGTTGMPKGTVWRHEDIFFGAMGGGAWTGGVVTAPQEIAGNAGADPPMTFMVLAPLMHGAAQWLALGGLLSGGRVVVYTGRHFDPDDVLRTAERERVNSLATVGDAMARPLAEAMRAGSYDLSALFSVGSGGAILSDAVKAELLAAIPTLYLADSYGSSELGAGGRSAGTGSGARFVVDDTVAVLDEVTLAPVVPGSGAVGKIARRGHIPLGYWNDEEKTAATFPTVDGVRWAIPGDFATIDADGTVVLLGRGSQCINTGGEKVYPEEVEAALKAHPAVFDSVVVGVPDPRFGERVVAVVAARGDERPSLDDLMSHCRTLVAGYKVPREVLLTPEIRRTNVGKADYKWARDFVAQAAGDASGNRG